MGEWAVLVGVSIALQSAFDFTRPSGKYLTARKIAWEGFNRLNIEFSRQLLTDVRAVVEQEIPVLIEIRRDLGLTTELAAFREQMEAQWSRMSAQFDALLSTLQEDR